MRKTLTILCLLCAWPLLASEPKEVTTTQTTQVQLRFGASFEKKWSNGLSLSLEEDLRSVLCESMQSSEGNVSTPAYFSYSYTTATFDYKPISYVNIGAYYTLRLIGKKFTTRDADEYIKHRFGAQVSGHYKYNQWSFSLRERLQCDLRTDSINPFEKARCRILLRHRVGVNYTARAIPLKPYLQVELYNTLNDPLWNEAHDVNYGTQFLRDVHVILGTKWRLSQKSSMNFFYRFTYRNDREINITHNKQKVEINHAQALYHSIGVFYEFGW